MRKILITILVMTLVGILAGGTCIAGVPGSISYQGKLTDTSGQPVLDGTYPVQFQLYTVITEGTPFWTSAIPLSVTTSGGVFTTQLSPLAASDLAGKTDVWMEIWVGSPLAALSPRTKFTSVPYALISGDSWSLLGNAGTTPGTNFLGTTDSQPLEFRVNNTRGFRLEPTSGTPNVIGGYSGNTAAGVYGATISGGGGSGYENSVTSSYGAVGGGSKNTASGGYATVGGGRVNTAGNFYATVGGGEYNRASNWYDTVGGGYGNLAIGSDSTIAGGYNNHADGFYSTIAGGYINHASSYYATVGGGEGNTASGQCATVPGGHGNTASGEYSFAAGRKAQANNNGAFVWADSTDANFASTAVNQFLIRASGGVGIGANDPAAALDVNGLIRSRTGGIKFPDGTIQTTAAWGLTGNAGTTPGTNFIGTTDSQALEFKVNNTRGFRLEPTSDTPNVIGGYSGNTVTAGAYGATISGGGHYYGSCANRVTADFGTVGGGERNTAADSATVGGGDGNTASGFGATVGGGCNNTAAYSATVGGGSDNTASGYFATVVGGYDNHASGDYSFAAGRQAKANNNGTFVWADSTGLDFISSHNDQFLIRAAGNVGINTNDPQYMLHVNGTVGGWGPYVNISDVRYKTNIETISHALDKVEKLRGVNFDWKKSEYPELAFGDGRQVGFVAQEIAQVLPEVVSKDSKGIYSVAYGSVVPVLVEAIKEQNTRLDRLETENGSLQGQIDDLKKIVAALQEKP